jgi:hypothetical protein
MKESAFVPESWSTSRVPELIPFVHRVPVEYQNQFPKSVLGMSFRTLPLSLVITQTQIRKEK